MVNEASEHPRQRRRGKELEEALLGAAWDELADTGYARLTMESVAIRGRTSESVLYRRWANKGQLVLAAIQHYQAMNPVDIPDEGTLRGDLLAYLTAVSEAYAGYFAVAAGAAFSGLLADAGLRPAQIRTEFMGPESLPSVRHVYRSAQRRGELDLDAVPEAVLEVPFDLVRHDLLLELQPLDPVRIRSIVDEVFLPLLVHVQQR